MGYDDKDIERAFNPKEFSIRERIQAFTIPVLVSFVLSLLFLSYSLGKLFDGFVVLLIIILFNYAFKIFYGKKLVNYLIGLFFLIIFAYSLRFESITFIIILGFVILHSITYAIKSKQSLETTFLAFFISLIFSLTLAFLFFILNSYVFVYILRPVNLFNIFLLSLPMVLILFIGYILISVRLLQRVHGGYDYTSYFRFSFFPFRVLNLFSSKDNLKKTVVRFAVVISVFFVAFAFVFTFFTALNLADELYSSHTFKDFVESIDPFNRFSHTVEKMGYNKASAHEITENIKDNFPLRSRFDVKYIYECENNLNCQRQKFDSELSLSKQTSLSTFGSYIQTENGTYSAIFLFPYESFEKRWSHNYFEPYDSLKNTKISEEITNKYLDMRDYVSGVEVKASEDLLNKEQYVLLFEEPFLVFYTYYSGIMYDDYDVLLHTQIKMSHDLHVINNVREIVLNENRRIRRNQENGTTFYDGSGTLQGHVDNLRSNVEQLYPKLMSLEFERDAPMPNILHDVGDTIYGKAFARMVKNSQTFFAGRSVKVTAYNFEYNVTKTEIRDLYGTIDVKESKKSKIFRLKILENQMVGILMDECNGDDCKKDLISITEDPAHCKDLSRGEAECIIEYSQYDKSFCEDIPDYDSRDLCYNQTM